MILYPAFVAALDGVDLDDLAARSGVARSTIEAIARPIGDGGIAATFTQRDRLARALDANPIELFRLDDDAEEALASAPSRYVTDPAVLRIIDRAAS